MSLALDAITELRLFDRWLFGLMAMLLSIVVFAQSTDQLVVSPAYDELLIDEIYNSAGGWRKSSAYESEWRPETLQQKSRIKFGYDSAYEEIRARDYNQGMFSGPDLEDIRPNNQMRIELRF